MAEKEYKEFTEDELKWIKRFKRVMKDAPSIFMFVGSGSVVLYPERVHNEFGGVDGYSPSIMVQTPMETDGGDW